MTKGILVINAGSTSVKFAGYRHDGGDELSRAARGQIEGIGSQPHFIVKGADSTPIDAHEWEADDPLTQDGALRFIFTWLKGNLKEITFAAAGHRLVLGGVKHDRPVHRRSDPRGTRFLCKVEPSISHTRLPHTGCRQGRAQHTTSGLLRYVLPPDDAGNRSTLRAPSICDRRQCAALGLSRHIVRLHKPPGSEIRTKRRRVIAAHLGGGCSLCAMLDGKSIDTTMGFSAIEGPPMSTRCGEIDAGILLYLLKSKAYDLEGLEKLLYKHAGLLGLSGISGDMRELLENKSPEAAWRSSISSIRSSSSSAPTRPS